MKYPDYISKADFMFPPIEEDLDMRVKYPKMESMTSWKDYPSKKYSWVDDEGKRHQNKNPRNAFNKIVMYILLVFDKNSPFHKNYQDVKKKKDAAIIESGISTELVKNEEVLEMIVDFLMFQNDKLWTEIVVHESLFSEYTGVLLKPMNDSRDKDQIAATNAKQKTREEFSSVRLQLEKLYEEFYKGDGDLKEIATKTVRFTPEGMAKIK